MTITAPLVTESDLDELVVDDRVVDEVTIDLTDAAAVTDVETSLLLDPLFPFLISASVSLIGVIVAAFIMSAGSFTF